MFYHSSKNTNSVNQSIEVFSFVLDLQQMGGGTACARQTPPTPHQASSLQLDSEKWGHEGRGHSQRDGTPSSTPLSPGSLPLHTTLFLTFSLRLEQTVLSLSSARLTLRHPSHRHTTRATRPPTLIPPPASAHSQQKTLHHGPGLPSPVWSLHSYSPFCTLDLLLCKQLSPVISTLCFLSRTRM